MGDHWIVEIGTPTLDNPTVCYSIDIEWKPDSIQGQIQAAQQSIENAVPQLAPGLQQARADIATLTSGNAQLSDVVAILERVVQQLAFLAQLTNDLAIHTNALPPTQ